MPLLPGRNPNVIHQNIHEMIAAGHPVAQAVAASLNTAEPKHRITSMAPTRTPGSLDSYKHLSGFLSRKY